jgi:tRNA threonylcarbamoyladenosine biosynthesis protein TsaB
MPCFRMLGNGTTAAKLPVGDKAGNHKLHYFAGVSLILNIDTAVMAGSVCLSKDAEVQSLKINNAPGESAAWIHSTIQQMLREQNIALRQLAAVAVSSGPGSYTGLRIGMATAKGLCYALKVPLIAINTLHMMTVAAAEASTDLLCPMIDARRMEVFAGVYTKKGAEVMPAQALVLQPDSFFDLLEASAITFFGNGSAKFRTLVQHRNAVFSNVSAHAGHLAVLAHRAFLQKEFADLAYSEPFYGKDFFSIAHKH